MAFVEGPSQEIKTEYDWPYFTVSLDSDQPFDPLAFDQFAINLHFDTIVRFYDDKGRKIGGAAPATLEDLEIDNTVAIAISKLKFIVVDKIIYVFPTTIDHAEFYSNIYGIDDVVDAGFIDLEYSFAEDAENLGPESAQTESRRIYKFSRSLAYDHRSSQKFRAEHIEPALGDHFEVVVE